ncbi:MAG: hypothetical protein GXO09_03555 [Crenarchaeota archaeon]|nr:hypothetical protein [Thermoproteota archaeon]
MDERKENMRRAVRAATEGTGARIVERHYQQMRLTGGFTEKTDIIAESQSYRLTVSMTSENIKVTLLVKQGSKESLSRIASMLEDKGLIVADVDKDRLVAGLTTRSSRRAEDMIRGMSDVLRRVSSKGSRRR